MEKERAQAEARSQVIRVSEIAEAEKEAQRKELEEARKQEINMLKAARGDVLAALVLAAELVPSMRLVAQAVAEHCKSPGLGPDGRPLPPAIPAPVAMGLLTRHASLIQKAVGAAETVIQLSRLERGAATAHVAIVDEEQLTEEQIDEELRAGQEALRAYRALPQ